MGAGLPLLRSHLYVPGNNPRLLAKAFLAGADAVVLDLEDAVPPAEKDRARGLVAAAIQDRAGEPSPAVFVRINHPASGMAEDDVHATVRPGLAGLRLPKAEDAETVRQVAAWLAQAEAAAGLTAGSVVLICSVESAAGVFRAHEIAAAHPRVLGLGYGAIDLAGDLGMTPGEDDLETLAIRTQLVLASRVAGIRPPVDAVYPELDDPVGLERATRRGRALGFFGKAAIHPGQVPIINAVYTPAEAEVARARAIVASAEAAAAQGIGALRLPTREFVDAAVVRRAQDLLRLAKRITPR